MQTAEYNYDQLPQLIAAATSAEYDSLLVAFRHRAELQESRALSADFLQKTHARFAAGTAARLDVIRARFDVAQAESDLIANAQTIAVARAGLNRLMARPRRMRWSRRSSRATNCCRGRRRDSARPWRATGSVGRRRWK